MFKFVLPAMLSAVLGCFQTAQAEASPTAPISEDPTALFYDVVAERLAIDGEHLLCEQPAYIACFNHDKTHCVTAQAPHKSACLEDFAASRAEHAAAGSSVPTYAFMRCMLEKHVAVASEAISGLTKCTDEAQQRFTASPYSKRIEVLYALALSNQRIDRDLCEQMTLFRCPADDVPACKQRINRHKDDCMATVKEAVLTAEAAMDESQAAQQYMSCLLIQNDCQ